MLNANQYQYVTTGETSTETTSAADSGSESAPADSSETTTEETVPSSLHMDPPEVDTEAPVFISYPRTISLVKGKEFVPDEYVGYIDDTDRDVELKVTGDVDINTVGDYPIKMTITDDAGNSKTIDVTVKVYTKKPTPTKKPATSSSKSSTSSTTKKKYNFSDLKEKYATGNAYIGIDVSKYQGNIDFNKVRDAGCHFVIIRMAIYNNGKFGIDTKFEENYKKAKEAGLLVGVYYYSVDNTEKLMKEHCAELAKALKGKEIDFPVAYDFEKWKGFQKLKMNSSDLNNMFYLFCSEMQNYGYEAMIYANPYFLRNWFKPGHYKIWLADWKTQPSYVGTFHFWQFSATGRIAGIQGDVDVNVYYPEGRTVEPKKEDSNG
jgi:GH25 family lysozyme M1 (1,4-beta-N-acetylmuramidase)